MEAGLYKSVEKKTKVLFFSELTEKPMVRGGLKASVLRTGSSCGLKTGGAIRSMFVKPLCWKSSRRVITFNRMLE